jgi:hypothetical protein
MNNYKKDIEQYEEEENAFKSRYGKNIAQAPSSELSSYNRTMANKNYAMSAYDRYNQIQSQDLNAKAQLSLAEQQARKYSQAMLDYQGLGNQGIAETTASSFRNAYMNSIGQQNIATQQNQATLRNEYKQNKVGLENQAIQEQNQKANDLTNQFKQYRSGLLSIDNANDVATYISMLEQYSGLTPEQIQQLINSDVDLAYHLKKLNYTYNKIKTNK